MAPFQFEAKAYPNDPGIYRMLSEEGKTLYIGKAINLRKRLSQYFQKKHDGRYQIDLLLPQVAKIETIATSNERDALVLENQLIKKFKPRYNIRLKDDKSYPYIRLSKDEFPRIDISRERNDEDYDYFGPYTVVGHASQLIEFITTRYGVRRCPGVPMKFLDRPCLYAQIGQCSAPCVKRVDQDHYQQPLQTVRHLLEGKTKNQIREAKQKMLEASEEQNYEAAASWRDIWQTLRNLESEPVLEGGSHRHLDILAASQHQGWTIVVILQVRSGVLSQSESFQLQAINSWEEQASSFLLEFYSHREIPDLIVCDENFQSMDLCRDILQDRADRKVELRIPQRGELRNWVSMARQNVRAELSCLEATGELGGDDYLKRIQLELQLPKTPKIAISLDAAILGKEEPVASVIVFKNGRPSKKDYRHFKIKSGKAGDIYMIEEVLYRYLDKCSDSDWPDAILIDGGEIQLNQAAHALELLDHKPDRSLLAIVKGEGRRSGYEQILIYGEKEAYPLEACPVSMKFWTEMRDEAHRFAGRLLEKRTLNQRLNSPFQKIPGIGPKAEKVLRDTFGNYDQFLKTDPDALEETKGLSQRQKSMLKHWLIANQNKD